MAPAATATANAVIVCAAVGLMASGTQAAPAASVSATFGETALSHLSPAEFRSQYLSSYTGGGFRAQSPPEMARLRLQRDGPAAVDWCKAGACSAVKDQGKCGSCWAFSATEQIESDWALQQQVSPPPELAVQQIVACDKHNHDHGCYGGDPSKAFQYITAAGGIESAAEYPYDPTWWLEHCHDEQKYVAAISGYTRLANETAMIEHVGTVGPLSVCLSAGAWQDYTGGIMNATTCGTTVDHCVQVVGYNRTDTAAPYWIVRNSWGTEWGMGGYIHLTMGDNTCGLASEPAFVNTQPLKNGFGSHQEATI